MRNILIVNWLHSIIAGVQKRSCEGCRDWHWEEEILGKPISAVPYLILPNFRQEEISFCTLWTWFLIKTYCSESSLFYHLVNKFLSNRIKRDDPSQAAQKTSDTEAYVVSCQKFLTFHLQETGSSDVFFDVSRDGHGRNAPLLSRCPLCFTICSAEVITLKVNHENPQILLSQPPHPAQYVQYFSLTLLH